jgi:hypothetical protein
VATKIWHIQKNAQISYLLSSGGEFVGFEEGI